MFFVSPVFAASEYSTFQNTSTGVEDVEIINAYIPYNQTAKAGLYTDTIFSSKNKELLVEWKIRELKRLKEDAPELFDKYQELISNKKAS